MSKLPNLKPREIERILIHAGFLVDTTKSSHRTYYHPIKRVFTTVAFHPGTVPQGTLRAIIRQTTLSVETFLSYR